MIANGERWRGLESKREIGQGGIRTGAGEISGQWLRRVFGDADIISQAGEPIGTWGAEWCAFNHDLAPKEVVTASISRCIILRRDREPYPGWIASAYPMNHTAVNV